MKKASTLKKELTNILKQEEELRKSLRLEIKKNKGLRPAIVASVLRYSNSLKIIEIYKGTSNEFSQAVALNVAAGLIVSGKENDFRDAFEKATKHLKSGNVFQYLSKIQSA